MKRMKLTKEEREIERAASAFVPVSRGMFEEMARAIAEHISKRKKDAVLNIRINKGDLNNLKAKAKSFGIPYQTFISEILHHHAA